jgi:2-polyprenyl-3-methyl-5-hydroxy-6-metoxy-1,4-benzoquinol methylase
MPKTQQQEALSYFRSHADDWKDKGLSAGQQEVNIIRQRNGFVLEVLKHRETTNSALDVGCGTGDLVCDIARLGIESTGIDFAEEMINLARAKAEQASLENARFHCCSIFGYDLPERRYDAISANGFIEYISLPELDEFLKLAHHALNPGGSLVFGSRNRLFNLLSLNAFTDEEISGGNATLLLREAIVLASGTSLTELEEIETAPIQSDSTKHSHTGIDVSTRYQFTPIQLTKMLKHHGFMLEQIYPVHIHGVPTSFKSRHPEVHTGISNLLQEYAGDSHCLVPYSSSFMLHAKR